MAVVVRTRTLKQLSWPAEESSSRNHRRASLCELDGLLAQLEEMNLKGLIVPGWVRAALQRHGMAVRPHHTASDMIEAIFMVQEQYMLRPDQGAPIPASGARDIDELRRRMAS
jgi:hypothetical protein